MRDIIKNDKKIVREGFDGFCDKDSIIERDSFIDKVTEG